MNLKRNFAVASLALMQLAPSFASAAPDSRVNGVTTAENGRLLCKSLPNNKIQASELLDDPLMGGRKFIINATGTPEKFTGSFAVYDRDGKQVSKTSVERSECRILRACQTALKPQM